MPETKPLKIDPSKCRNCGSDSVTSSRLYNDVRWGEQLQYHKCLHCLVEFHDSLRDPISFYTSGEYRRRAGMTDAVATRITAQRARQQVMWLDRTRQGWRKEAGKVLDIGAYQGIAVKELRNLGIDAFGYEPDETQAEKDPYVGSDITVFDAGKIDMLWLSHVLEHADSAIDMLKLWKPYAEKAFIEVPPGNYQLPHILVFRMDSFLRTLELADMGATVIDQGIRAIVEWDNE